MWNPVWRDRSPGRWVVVAVGLAVLTAALDAADEPYRQTREFRAVAACDQTVGNCFDSEPGAVTSRRTYTTTSTSTDANGHTTTTTTTHHEVTWRRSDGSPQTREVSSRFYSAAEVGRAATLRLHRGEVVGVVVAGETEWFLPGSGALLGGWLLLAFLGLGVALWGLLFGWWDGFFMLVWRTGVWAFLGIVLVSLTTASVAYGLGPGALSGGDILSGLFAVGVAGAMIIGSLDDWSW